MHETLKIGKRYVSEEKEWERERTGQQLFGASAQSQIKGWMLIKEVCARSVHRLNERLLRIDAIVPEL